MYNKPSQIVQDVIIGAVICLSLLVLVQCAEAQSPDVEPHVLCVSPYVLAHDRAVMAKVAHLRGYDVFVGHSEACDVTLFVDAEDTVGADHITYREERRLHAGRAEDLLVSWETFIRGGK